MASSPGCGFEGSASPHDGSCSCIHLLPPPHGVKLDALAWNEYLSGMDASPSEAAVQAWARLVRVSGSLLDAVEAELKAAGFPPLAWYDALLELDPAPDGRLRPFELERHMLLAQYSTSRLVDRLERAGFVERLQCPADGR